MKKKRRRTKGSSSYDGQSLLVDKAFDRLIQEPTMDSYKVPKRFVKILTKYTKPFEIFPLKAKYQYQVRNQIKDPTRDQLEKRRTLLKFAGEAVDKIPFGWADSMQAYVGYYGEAIERVWQSLSSHKDHDRYLSGWADIDEANEELTFGALKQLRRGGYAFWDRVRIEVLRCWAYMTLQTGWVISLEIEASE